MEVVKVPEVAIILASGKGTRLKPITNLIPKPLVKVGSKPIIAHIIDELERNGIKVAYVTVCYKADKIISYLKNYKSGVEIKFVKEGSKEPLGTGTSAKAALKEVRKRYSGDIFMTNGDDLFTMDIAEMYKQHKRKKAEMTIAVRRASAKDIRNSGVVALKGTRITKFVEKPKPKEAPSRYINIGKYIMSTDIYSKLPKKKAFSIEKDFMQKEVSRLKMHAYASKGLWYPADNMERLAKAREAWKQ